MPATLAALAGLWILLDGRTSRRAALGVGWWFGLGHFLLGQHWIAHAFQFQANMPAWLGWVAVGLLSMLMACYPAVACGIGWRVRSGGAARALMWAAAWMLTEWLRGWLFSGFPWNPLGVTQIDSLGLAQAAAAVGALGLTGLTVLSGAALGALSTAARAPRWPRAILAVYVTLALGGLWLARADTPADGAALAIVQANIGQDEKWRDDAGARNLARYEALSAGRATTGPRLLIWPEAAVTTILDEDPVLIARLARLLRPGDQLVTGGLKAIRAADGRAVAARNSLYVIDHRGQLLHRYDKAELVPFGEFLPLRPLMEAIGVARLAPGALDFWPGPGPRTLHLPGFPAVSPRVCYEIIFADASIDRSDPPGWLLNASNDAWFSDAGAYMHLAQARLRAIEQGMSVARATPTGISAVIDPRGRVVASIARDRAGRLDMRLPAALPPTPYRRAGEIIPLLLALMMTVASMALARRN